MSSGATTINQILRERGIEEIALIDDAFEAPLREDLSDDDINDFISEVIRDKDKFALLTSICGQEISDADDVDNNMLKQIYKGMEGHPLLIDAYNKFLNVKGGIVNDIKEALHEALKLKINIYGTEVDPETINEQMVFIDYLLGPKINPTKSKQKSKDIVYHIRKKYKYTDNLPIIVLMTSDNVSEKEINDFRIASELLKGIFHFFKKNEIDDENKLLLKLNDISSGWKAGKNIQNFVDSIEDCIENTMKVLRLNIKDFAVEDYAYIQELTLKEEGQPLGDYMLWLLGSYFGRILQEDPNVDRSRKELDKAVFFDLPPNLSSPSEILSTLYNSALYDPTDRDIFMDNVLEDGTVIKVPKVNLGDIFFRRSDGDIFIIVNAQCDLVYTLGNDSRPFDPETIVFFVPGKIIGFQDQILKEDYGKPLTDFIDISGDKKRVIWDTNKWDHCYYGSFHDWVIKGGYERISRLRVPYILQIQKVFFDQISRIGTPVRPPIYSPAKIRLYSPDGEKKCQKIGEYDGSAYMFITRDGSEKCILTYDFVNGFKDIIPQVNSTLVSLIEYCKSSNKEQAIPSIEAWIDGLKEYAISSEMNRILRGPFKVPQKGTEQIGELPIVASRNSDCEGKSYGYRQPLMLSIDSE